jgi:hypothetical protein
MTKSACDIHEALSGLRSEFRQLKQDRDKAFNFPGDFLNQELNGYFGPRYDVSSDEVVRQPVDYHYDICDDDSDDDAARPVRCMMMRIETLFSMEPKKKQRPTPPSEEVNVPLPPPPKILYHCQTQSATVEYRSVESQSALSSAYVDQATVALSHTQSQTHSLKRRNNATNTDSVLPSYENVCIAFLESLLSDAPVFMNQAPRPEQIEDILMQFLHQLLQDAHQFEGESEMPPQPAAKPAFGKKPKTANAIVQKDMELTSTATQSFVSLKTCEVPRVVVNIPREQPGRLALVDRPVACFEAPLREKTRLQVMRDVQFQFPPSLRAEEPKRPLRLSESVSNAREEADSPQHATGPDRPTGPKRSNLRIYTNVFQDTVVPDQRPPRSERPPPIQRPPPSFEEPPTSSQRPLPSRQRPVRPIDIDPIPARRPQPRPKPKQPEIALPTLLQLQVGPLDEIEDLSTFNLESMMAEIESSDDGLGLDDSIADSQISALFGSSPGQYSVSSASNAGDLSSGEVTGFDSFE